MIILLSQKFKAGQESLLWMTMLFDVCTQINKLIMKGGGKKDTRALGDIWHSASENDDKSQD